jgi:WD40 repeat protein
LGTALTAEDPERVGGYWLASRLGTGGQGVVYEAYDAAGDRVALKVLHPGAAPFVRDRFTKEAEAARSVASFCTARVLDVSCDGETPYLVSEFVAGPTLGDRVRSGGPLDDDSVVRLATGAATALAAVHGAGVIHRDLKPGNILLGPDGPRIIDFGIARAPDMSLTATGAMMGTLGYMAPEVLSGGRAGAAADVFAWGAVVLYAASATEPFRGENLAEVAYRTASVEPDLSAIPEHVRPLVSSALAKEPSSRPTAQELLLGLVGGANSTPEDEEGGATGLLQAGTRRAASPPEGGAGARSGSTAVVPPLGDRAEAAFLELPAQAQFAAVELLLRLVVPGDAADGSQDSVRTATADELYGERPQNEHRSLWQAVAGLAAAGVLVVGGDDSVRPVSAALLPAWPRLRGAVAAERAGLAVHRTVGQAARAWKDHGERPEDLMQGTVLRTALDWLAAPSFGLRPNPLELRFLTAARERGARTARRRRQALSATAVLAVLALVAGVLAWSQLQESERQRAQATARSVAQVADNLRGSAPDTALLLSLAAWRISPTPEARSALHSAATQRESAFVQLPVHGPGDSVGTVLASNGGRVLSYEPSVARSWNLTADADAVQRPTFTHEGSTGARSAEPPAVSPDGRLLALTEESGAYRIVSTDDGKAAGKFPGRRGWHPVQLSDKGHVLLSDSKGKAYRLLSPSGTPIVTSDRFARGFGRGVLSPDGTRYAACTVAGLTLWSFVGGRAAPVGNNAPSSCESVLGFSGDGSRVLLSADDRLHVVDARNGRAVGEADIELDRVRLSAQGRFVVGHSAQKGVEVWPSSGSPEPLLTVTERGGRDGDRWDVNEAALDERTATLTYTTRASSQLHRLDLTSALQGAEEHADSEGVGLSPDGGVGLVRSGEAAADDHDYDAPLKLSVVDMRTGRTVGKPLVQTRGPGQAVAAVLPSAVSDRGDRVAYATWRGPENARELVVVVHDTRTGKETATLPAPKNHDVQHLVLSPDGRHVAFAHFPVGVPTGADGYVDVWDVSTGERVHRSKAYDARARFSPDGKLLVTTAGEVLDLASGRVRRAPFGDSPTTDLAFSPDGSRLAVLKDSGWMELWDGRARERVAVLPGPTVHGGSRHGDRATGPSFSADGTLLAAVVGGDSVQLWDVEALIALGLPVTPTGRRIDAMSLANGALRILSDADVTTIDLSPDRIAAGICARTGRDITREEWETYVPDASYRSLC